MDDNINKPNLQDNPSTEGINKRPRLITEIVDLPQGVLIVGEKSSLARFFRETMAKEGIQINNENNFKYIFQFEDFDKTNIYLEKAQDKNAKFFLILDERKPDKFSKEAEKITQNFLQSHNNDGEIIKLKNLFGKEEEFVKQIWALTLRTNLNETVILENKVVKNDQEEILSFFPQKEEIEKEKSVHPPNRFPKVTTLFFFLLIIISPLIFVLSNVFLGLINLKSSRDAIINSQFEKAEKRAWLATEHFSVARRGINKIEPLFYVLGKEDLEKEIEDWFTIGEETGQMIGHLTGIGRDGQQLMDVMVNKKQKIVEEKLIKISDSVNLVEEELGLIEAKLSNKKLPSSLEQDFEKIKKARKSLTKLKDFLPTIPWALGLEEERTYLVIFQNNFELRPGGGFIGTIGFLTLNNGLLDLQVQDVYTVDGQLKGHVEPPTPIRKYLEQAHWYLRDSNWDPEFTVNAQKAAWFLDKEIKKKVDGVIAIDLVFAQKILDLTDPITLPDYQEKISKDNLFLKAEVYSQDNFFPGSTQKKDFLGALANALFEKLSSEKRFPWFGIGRAIEEAAQEKHLFFFINNEDVQRVIGNFGWDGKIIDNQCPSEEKTCLDDYLMVLEANLGVNKVNYFIKREIAKEIEFKEKVVNSRINISYENTSPAGVSFSGDYKNYLRVLLPSTAILDGIRVEGNDLDLETEIDKEIIHSKFSVGFLVNVPKGEKRQVEILYHLPLNIFNDEFIYKLYVQKQAGTEKDPFGINILPIDWTISETNLLDQEENLRYNGDLLIDRNFFIKFKGKL